MYKHYPIREEEIEPDHYRQCVVCRERNAFPGRVCQYCFDRALDEEAEAMELDGYETLARGEPEYKKNPGGHSPPTEDLFRAAIGESTVALYKGNFREQADNLFHISVVIRERMERFREEFEREKVGEGNYRKPDCTGPSLIDLAFRNSCSERPEYKRKAGHS